MKRITLFGVLSVLLLFVAQAWAQDVVIEDFQGPSVEKLQLRESVEGSLSWKIESESSNTFLHVELARGDKAGYAYLYLPVTDELTKHASEFDGVKFRVKGDGSGTFGLLEIRTDGYVNIFQAIFPLDSTQWREVSIRWEEFFQTNDVPEDSPKNWQDTNVFAFGSRAGWGSCSYSVDDVALSKIPPREPVTAPDGYATLAKTAALLAQGRGLKIVALGDSITYGAQVPSDKRKTSLYYHVAAKIISDAFGGAEMTLVNAGVGGDTIAEGLIRIGHKVAAEEPDLVLVLLGANDAIYLFPDSRVRRTMELLLDTLLETTDAEILLLGPTPILNKPGTPERYGQIYREIACEKKIAFLDLSPAMTILARTDYKRALADTVHLSAYGHEVIGKAIGEHIVEMVR